MRRILSGFSGFLAALLVITQISGCAVHYKEANQDAPASDKVVAEKVFYQIRDVPILSANGPKAVEDEFMKGPLFRQVEAYYEDSAPEKGIYVLVEPEYQAPTLPAIVFGYLSVSTLTLLPAWSNHDGFNVYYRVYLDGELAKTYKYETRRFLAVWAGLLPVSWVNFMTAGEKDAFAGMTRQFLHDVRPLMESRVKKS